jgi:hypothetical protein
MCRGTFSLCKWWLYFDDCALHWGVQALHFSDLKDNIYNFFSPLNGKKGKKKRAKWKKALQMNINHQYFQCLSDWQKQWESKPWIFQYTCLWHGHYEGSFVGLFYKERIAFGCTQYYDVVKVDGNVYCYFRYTMIQTFSI